MIREEEGNQVADVEVLHAAVARSSVRQPLLGLYFADSPEAPDEPLDDNAGRL